MKKNNIRFHILHCILSFMLILINFTYINSSTIEEIQKAIQEIAYSYYMRGKYIQYNDKKRNFFPPEEATQQNVNFLVCSAFTRTVYMELLNVTIPEISRTLLEYSYNYLGKPEVIAYSKTNTNNDIEMYFYSPNVEGNLTKINNPSLHEHIIPRLQIGDILTYTGHAFLIYDIERDKEGIIKDAIIMESTSGNNAYVISKLSEGVVLPSGSNFGSALDYLYLDYKNNTQFKEGREQGTVNLRKLSAQYTWKNINNTKSRANEYSILRFVQKDSKGNAILKYTLQHKNLPNDFLNDDVIILPKRNTDRIKFSHLYIEKIVNKFNGCIVEVGEILNYKIIIKNEGDKDYIDDLLITENLSEYVTFESHYETKEIKSFKYEINNNKLMWNIGKLQKGEKIIVSYYVKIIRGNSGDIIESVGNVGNIPSSTIINIIGVNLDNKKKNIIKQNFEKLKNKHNGKKLINEIYKESFNINIKLDEFDLRKLIINKRLNSTSTTTIYLDKNNTFYNSVFNKYWSTLSTVKYAFIPGGEEVDIHALKYFEYYSDPNRRQDFIYYESFQTGDILIYQNYNDSKYSLDSNNKLVQNYITYENGEYAYIFIEGKGFVGVNLGNDKNNVIDDRNEFNAKYYKDNKFNLHFPLSNRSEEFLEVANLQTLFGKDYYVILRPSLIFDFKYNEKIWIRIIVPIMVIMMVGFIVLILILKRRKKQKNNNNLLSIGLTK